MVQLPLVVRYSMTQTHTHMQCIMYAHVYTQIGVPNGVEFYVVRWQPLVCTITTNPVMINVQITTTGLASEILHHVGTQYEEILKIYSLFVAWISHQMSKTWECWSCNIEWAWEVKRFTLSFKFDHFEIIKC